MRTRGIRIAAAGGLIVWASIAPGAPIKLDLYVDAQAKSGGDGARWSMAYADLQDAIAAADLSSATVVHLWLAPGVYRPDKGTGDRLKQFAIGFGQKTYEKIEISGAISGGATILSGDLLGNDGVEWSNRSDNSYAVIALRATKSVSVSWLTVRGASSVGFGQDDSAGSGFYAAAYEPGKFRAGTSQVELTNCIIEDNESRTVHGAGASIVTDSAWIANNKFRNNRSLESLGGGLHVRAKYEYGTLLRACEFERNHATFGGGAFIDAYAESQQNVFVGNSAEFQGGGMFGTVPTLSCLFIRNAAGAAGGALAGSLTTGELRADIVNSTFVSNSATRGAAVAFSTVGPWIYNSIFWSNSGDESIHLSFPLFQTDFKNSILQGGDAGMTSDGLPMRFASIVDSDPMFRRSSDADDAVTDWRKWNYRPKADSPAIGMGVAWFGQPDLDGRRASSELAAPMDAGCYYVTTTECVGNLYPPYSEPVSMVDDSDFVEFLKAYEILLSPPANFRADLNLDGFVDDADFSVFAAAYDQLICP